MAQNQQKIIPIYASNGDAEAFLVFPHLFNRSGEWIGWVTPKREVYSVMGLFVGTLSDDARITRRRGENDLRPRLQPPPRPKKLVTPSTIPLAPLMRDLPISIIDVLQDEPERLHTPDSGELREDMD
jgi:hypothetical protein